jgi:6-phosphogluconolactonase
MSTSSLFAQNPPVAYVADYASNAISVHSIDPTTGALTQQAVFPTPSPISIVVTPSGNYAYVANYLSQGTVSAFSINPTTGALTTVAGSPFVAGSSPYSVTLAPSGRFLYAANLGSNDISAFSLDPNTGALTPVPGSPFGVGTTPYFMGISPSGQFAYVANEGSNTISAFSIDPNTGALTPVPGSPFADPGQSQDITSPGGGAGPSFIAVAPSGQFAYVANLLSWTIAVYNINATTGALTPIMSLPFPTAPEPFNITFSPTGQFMYVSNAGTPDSRQDGSVSVYSVNAATGALTPVTGSPFASGAATVFVGLDSSNGLAYTANAYSNTISGFSISPTTGELSPIAGSPFTTGSYPHSIAFPSACPLLTINAASANPAVLWPPNHEMISVAVSVGTTGGCGAVSCQIVSISSNEPVDRDGDWVITGDLTLDLRAERLGNGTGRIYTITVRCTDGSGNSTTTTVLVAVRHDQGNWPGKWARFRENCACMRRLEIVVGPHYPYWFFLPFSRVSPQ